MNNVIETDRRAIVVVYELAHAPAKVWRALTDASCLAQWLMPNDIRAEVGHRFTFRTDPAPGFDGIVHCEVLDVEPPARFVYTWRSGTLDTLVTWTLTPTPAGTRLRLEHGGFGPEHGATYAKLDKGWGQMAPSLDRALAAMT